MIKPDVIEFIKELREDLLDGHLRETFEEVFPKDQEAIDGIRPSKSNRGGALLYQGEIHAYLANRQKELEQ
jgi:hypothetical protein